VTEVEIVGLADATGARRHDDQLGRHEQRFLDAVGDEEHHLPGLAPDLEDQLLHGLARQCVERPQGLVHEQHRRVAGQRAGDPHALLHAAGQLVHFVMLEAGQPHEGKVVEPGLFALLLRGALQPQTEADVVENVEPRQQRMLLEHHAAIPPGTLDRAAVEQHVT